MIIIRHNAKKREKKKKRNSSHLDNPFFPSIFLPRPLPSPPFILANKLLYCVIITIIIVVVVVIIIIIISIWF